MPINPTLLVSAAMLQDYLVDKDTGLPLANGTISLYKDNSRTTFKNWYYQTGTPGNYTYITLPNPMTLSAVGTIVDINGNDTIPFYYPFSETDNSTVETYYITVKDQDGELQFVRANFPFVPNLVNEVDTDTNYAFNNSFWRNIGQLNLTPSNGLTKSTTVITGSTLLYETVAPGQHDGYTMPDMLYMKSANASTETITFKKFPNGANPLTGDITPEFYLEHNCSSPGAEGNKFYQIPISLHIKQLESVDATFTIQAISNSGTVNDVITISLFQFNGTGTVQNAPQVLSTIQLTNQWTKYPVKFTFPSVGGAPISPGDDAWFIRIGVPANAQFNLSFTLPSLFLSQNNLPTNDFSTYDQVDSIINTPRTGDVRVSMNDFYPYGWLPMNDGTIGNAVSNATTRANTDTWQLFYLLWNKFHFYVTGTANPIAQMFNSGGVAVAYGANAIDDFNANNQLALTKMMGRVILGTAPIDALLDINKRSFAPGAVTNSGGLLLITIGSGFSMYKGMPLVFTNTGGALPPGLTANTVYYMGGFNATQFLVSTSFANAMAGTFIAFGGQGTGTHTVTSELNGALSGEYAHTQLDAELAAHNHPGSYITTRTALPNGSPIHPNATAVQGAPVNMGFDTPDNNGHIGVSGASTPFNVTQPGSFNNIYIKL